jgi:uncharacterized protein (TIGR00255 family)
MINSMTGFGESEVKTSKFRSTFQINSVNNRFLDIKFNTGRMLGLFEPEFSSILKKHIRRGKVEIYFDVTFEPGANQLRIDDNVVKSLISETKRIVKKFHIKNSVSMSDIFGVKNVFSMSEARINEKDLGPLKKGFEEAVKKLVEMRSREGKHLEQDILGHLGEIEEHLGKIKKDKLKIEEAYKKKLLDRSKAIKEEFTVDNNRLMTEISILLGKGDVSEELARLQSHITQFRTFLGEEEPVGRKLDFLSQELLREVNTIGSKISDEKVTNSVIRIKDFLEKIREQVQNIE